MKKFTSYFAVFGTLALLSSLLAPTTAHAAVTGSDWQAGNIVSDIEYYDSSNMSVQDIQNFLNSKVPACDTYGTQPASDMRRPDITRAQYAALVGMPAPPYVCLRDYHQVPRNDVVINNFSGSIPAGAISAAQIIKNAADTYGVSPKALIALIQRESANLIFDTWPLERQYRSAMGFACPDTAPCNPAYNGFYNQVMNAAKQIKLYRDNEQYYRHRANQTTPNLYYNPNLNGCGSSSVYIQNHATASLYNYTPYQPNTAALNNLYGTGDGCSAYGNRNFWTTWNNWFGYSQTPLNSARTVEQSEYPTIATGFSKRVFIKVLNQGRSRWYDDTAVPSGQFPVRLAATSPINRTSTFSKSWSSGGRPASSFSRVYESDGITLAVNQHAAEPGEYVVWEFDISVPLDTKPGIYRESFQPVFEGSKEWAMGGLSWLDITVKNSYKATPIAQSRYSFTAPKNSVTTETIRYRNDGESYWYDTLTAQTNNTKAVRLSRIAGDLTSNWPSQTYATSTFGTTYLSDGVTPSPFQHVVRPGEIVELTVSLTIKETTPSGTNRQMIEPRLDGIEAPPIGGLAWYDVNVINRTGSAVMSSQAPYPILKAGNKASTFFAYRNNTNTPWYSRQSAPNGILPVSLVTYTPLGRYSTFSYDWPSHTKPLTTFSKVTEDDGVTISSNQQVVFPGQIAFFNFNLTAPWLYQGSYREYFAPIVEGADSPYQGGISWMDISVN